MDSQIEKVEGDDLSRAIWLGKGATALALIGQVRQAEFEKIFDSFRTVRG